MLQIDSESTCKTSFLMSWSVSESICKTSFFMSWSVSDIRDKSGTIVLVVEGSTTLLHFSDWIEAGDEVLELKEVLAAKVLEVEGVAVDGDIEEEAIEVGDERFLTPWHFFLVSGDFRAPGKSPSRYGYS